MSEQKNELRQIITDALVSMVSGVTGLVPPSGPGAIPDFIQAPIDRAVERISASLPVGVPDDWRRAIYQAEECLTGCLAAPDIARALDAETVRKIIADLQSARFGMLTAVQVTNFKKAQPEVAENTGSHAMANQLQRQGLTVSAEVDGAATPGEASDADDRKCEAPNCGCADAFCKAWPDQDDFAAPTVKAEQVQCDPAPSLPAAGSADQPYLDGIADDLERSDWTPIEALQWYATGKHFDVAGGRTRIIDTGAVASNALKHASLAYLELKGDAELSELRAALSAQQSAPERVGVHSLTDVDRYRIELLPEHESGYVAKAYVEESEPVAEASGFTAVEAVREVIALLASHGRGEA